jgi:uncharacterized protein YcaQ
LASVVLTNSQARKIILYAAGLSKRRQFGKGKEAVYKFIEHLGFVQIDTNYVVERAHHHAIWARVPDYKPEWLGELQSDGRVFEFWTLAAGYIPMNNFRFSLPVKDGFAARYKPKTQAEVNLMKKVLDRISREGPLMSSDFENDRVTKNKGWWDWRPSKVALERLHLFGDLMTTRTKKFHKVYDITENLLPRGIDTAKPTPEEYSKHVIFRALKMMGIAYANEIAWTSRYAPNSIKKDLKKLADDGDICEVKIEGLKASQPLYMHPDYVKKKVNLSGDAFILSPFDILNVFRRRLRDFFDFDYQVECFVPEPKRKYGYFSLPVLIGETFVSRMDCKADRKEKIFNINNLHFEQVKFTKDMIAKLADAIEKFTQFNQCKEIVIKKTNNRALAKAIRARLEQ